MKEVEISKDLVALSRLLKFEGMATSSGEAKFFISEGHVLLNEKVKPRKRKNYFWRHR